MNTYSTIKDFSIKLRTVKAFIFIIIPSALLIGYFLPQASESLNTIGINLIKLISFPAIPLVLSAVILSINSITRIAQNNKNHSTFSKSLIYTLLSFLFLSSVLAILLSLFIKPGILTPEGKLSIGKFMLDITDININLFQKDIVSETKTFFIDNLIPSNIFSDVANSQTLKVIVGSLISGLGLASLPIDTAKPILAFLKSLNSLSKKVLEELLILSPLMLICLIAGAFSSISTEIILALLNLGLCVLLSSVASLGISKFLFKKFTSSAERKLLDSNPIDSIYLLALSTGSSMACFPTVTKTLKNIGRDPDQAEASASISLLIARIGNIIYNVIVIIFALNLYEVSLTPIILLEVLLFGIITGIATAGLIGVAVLPSIGIALTFFEVPVEPIILLIVSIDPIVQLIRVSMTGVFSLAISTIVCSKEKKEVLVN